MGFVCGGGVMQTEVITHSQAVCSIRCVCVCVCVCKGVEVVG